MKWVYLATAPVEPVAQMWRNLLEAQGVPAVIHPGDTILTSYLGVSTHPVRIMVPEDRLSRAREILEEHLEEGIGPVEG